MTKAGFFWRSRLNSPARHLHWFAATFGVMACFACAAFLISNPIGTSQPWPHATGWKTVGQAPGLSGTTFSLLENQVSSDQIVGTEARQMQPAAWNDIATPGCLTVTTENGQKLSFRINGYRTAAQEKQDASIKVDLAVTACSQSSKKVVNAVFEPDASDTVMKNVPAAERNL